MSKDKYKLSNLIISILIISAISFFVSILITNEVSSNRSINFFAYVPISQTIDSSLYGEDLDKEHRFNYAIKSYKMKYYYPNGEVVDDTNLIKTYEQKKSLEEKGLDPKDFIDEEYFKAPEITGKYGTFYLSNDIYDPTFEPLELDTAGKDFYISGTVNNNQITYDRIYSSSDLQDSRYDFLIDSFKRSISNQFKNLNSEYNIENLKFAYYGNLDDQVFKTIERNELRDNSAVRAGISVVSTLILSFIIALIASVTKIDDSEDLKKVFLVPIELVIILFLIFLIAAFSILSMDWAFNNLIIFNTLFYLANIIVSLTTIYFVINLKSVINLETKNYIFENSILFNIINSIVSNITSTKEDGLLIKSKRRFSFVYYGLAILLILFLILTRTNPIIILILLAILIISYFMIRRNVDEISLIYKESSKIVDGDYKSKITKTGGIYDGIIDNFNNISSNLDIAVEEALKSERLKTELITNVSHDLKTPLTSLINYSDLLNKEGNSKEEIEEYSKIINEKSNKLKVLIEDLFEVSKATSNNIELEKENLDFKSLIAQSIGEWEDKISEKNIEIISKLPEEKVILNIDGQKMSRVLDNLFSNVSKYALENSRVYLELESNNEVKLTIKNISKYPLDITPDELMERFTRGEKSRTTSGSGLGLSIASSFVRAHGASFDIDIDGDLFKVTIIF